MVWTLRAEFSFKIFDLMCFILFFYVWCMVYTAHEIMNYFL